MNAYPAAAAGKPAAICCARYKNRCGFGINIRHAGTELTGQVAQTIVRQRLAQGVQAPGSGTAARFFAAAWSPESASGSAGSVSALYAVRQPHSNGQKNHGLLSD
jgi:hypothetical protein